MTSPLDAFVARADIANLALLLWALGTSAALYAVFRELGAANRRFDAFVRELARFNERQAKARPPGAVRLPTPRPGEAAAERDARPGPPAPPPSPAPSRPPREGARSEPTAAPSGAPAASAPRWGAG